MFGMSIIQVLLILVYVGVCAWDTFGPQFMFFQSPLCIGLFIGLILGDWQTGLYIGAMLGLMSLGTVGIGGASVTNYTITTVVTTIVAIQTGAGYEVGRALGLPVGMINIYLDIMIKTVNVGIANTSQALVNKGEVEKGIRMLNLCMILNVLQYLVPVTIIIFAGEAVATALMNMMPAWLNAGLTVAGKLLPAVGLAALINFMPWRKHFPYMMIGYVAAAYLGLPTLAVSIIGIAAAVMFWQGQKNNQGAAVATGNVGGLEDE